MVGKFTLGLSMLCRRKHTMSTIYRPSRMTPRGHEDHESPNKLSKSFRLMVDHGLIRPSSCPGAYHYLPLGLRCLEKLIRIVDDFMETASCQKIQMPLLTSEKLWELTGRLEGGGVELMKLGDRHSKRFILSPTHEEAVCDLVNCHPTSYRQLPLRLYQITEKFRDEKRPRYGLLRGRQFLMKDLYTFDTSEEAAKKTYQEIVDAYGKLFSRLGLKWVKASGSTGTIGGSQSDEFHLLSSVGENSLIQCHSCNEAFNAELVDEKRAAESIGGDKRHASSGVPQCIHCGSSELSSSNSIEVGHAFLLGTKYTKPFNSRYLDESSAPVLMEMGCYGIGVSRLLAAAVEVLSTENEIRLPPAIAPFWLSIIPPKAGSKEERIGLPIYEKFSVQMHEMLGSDIVIDDRVDLTVGKRLLDAKKLGIPYIAIFGRSILNELHPVIELQDINSGEIHSLNDKEIISFLYEAKSKK